MASLLLLIKTRRLLRRERDTVLHRVRVAINWRVIAKINDWLCMTFWNRNSYTMTMVRAMWWLHDKIHDVLCHNNFVVKSDINLIAKNH